MTEIPDTYVRVSRRPADVEDCIDILRRYGSWILGLTFAGLVAAVVTAFLWPDTYVSSAVMRITPKQVPHTSEPTRLAFVGMGTAAGLILGIVLAGVKEIKNTTLKNLKDVQAYTNLPVLGSIPLLENPLLVRRKRRLFWLAWSAAIIIGIAAMSGSMFYYYSRI
ncbi:MAG TPA: hypothetical protein VH640_19420 [Bryobacteraceae bacterium]|jgi:capsular polysaccharide biosynthesis protein